MSFDLFRFAANAQLFTASGTFNVPAPAPEVIEPTHVALGRLFEHFTDTSRTT